MTERPDLSFAIIGAGFGGLGMAIELLRSGYRDITIFEARDGVGGVWRANTYPGAACDVPSHLYSFSFDLNPDWSRKFSPQAEILAYLEGVTERHGPGAPPPIQHPDRPSRMGRRPSRWQLTTDDGATHHADVLIPATGQLRLPRYPDLPGRDDFRGTQFHSAEWNHDHQLAGERVAVIGTGASAIQFVPEIVDEVGELFVFQRSAPWVLPKPDRAFTEQEKARFQRHPRLMRAYRESIFARFDARFSLLFGARSPGARMFELAEGKYLDAVVKDPDLRQALTPTDPPGLQAPAHVQRLVPRPGRAARRGGDRPHRAHHRHRCPHRLRAQHRRRHDHLGNGIPRLGLPGPDGGHRPGRPQPAPGLGRRAPRPTSG